MSSVGRRISILFAFAALVLLLTLPATSATAVEVPSGRWYVRAYNVDDQSRIYINGTRVANLSFRGDSGWIGITSQVAATGLDTTVRCWAYNGRGGYTWGYQIGRKSPGATSVTALWTQQAGAVGVTGANSNDQTKPTRVVFDKTYRLGAALSMDGNMLAGRWFLRAYNVDDQSKMYINGTRVAKLGFKGDSGWIDVTSQVAAKGLDTTVGCWAYNGGGGYAWGYQIGRKLPGASSVRAVWTKAAGTVGVTGANSNDQSKKNQIVLNSTYRLGTLMGWDDPRFPLSRDAGQWFGLTYPNHDSYGAYQYSAVDFNMAGDADDGQPIYAIQDGTLHLDHSYVSIQHTKPLYLKNGTRIMTWYSLYGHLTQSTALTDGSAVAKGTLLGWVSNVGADNNHLHFVLFRNWNSDRASAISPYWLPGFYSASKSLYADDQYGNRDDGGEPGLYDNRIFSSPPAQ